MRRLAVLALISLCFSGCATEGTSIPIGTAKNYAPTAPDGIVLLVAPPQQRHEIIALVEGVASTDDYLSEKRTQDAAIEAMRKEAARLGANAIVLTSKGTEPYAQVTTGTGAAFGGGAGNAYFSSVSQTMGWQKIRIGGTAVRYTE